MLASVSCQCFDNHEHKGLHENTCILLKWHTIYRDWSFVPSSLQNRDLIPALRLAFIKVCLPAVFPNKLCVCLVGTGQKRCLGLQLLQCNKMNNQYCILNCTPCCIIIISSCKLNKKFISFILQYYIQDCDYIAKNAC